MSPAVGSPRWNHRRQASRREGRSEAEELLLADALAVRMVLTRMEEAIRRGTEEGPPSDRDALFGNSGPAS